MAVKKIFVGGIKDGIGENDVHEYFMQYGNVVSVDLVTDRETGRKRGFGFVVFDDVDCVDKVVCKCCARIQLNFKVLSSLRKFTGSYYQHVRCLLTFLLRVSMMLQKLLCQLVQILYAL